MSQLDTLKVIQDVISCFMFTNVRRVMKYDSLINGLFILTVNSFLTRLDALRMESSVCQGYGISIQQET